MRVAVYYNLPFSGAKRTVFEHVKGLINLGHEVDVYTLDENNDLFSPAKIASNIFKYKYHKTSLNFPFLKKVTSDLSDFISLKNLHKKIAADIDNNNYDIALIHTDYITQAPFILRFLKTNSVYFCLEPLKMAHEYSFKIENNLPLLNRIYEEINKIIRKNIDINNARSANSTMAISKFGRELMISSFDLYPDISYLGVDEKLFKKLNVEKKNQIFFVGQKLKINGYNYLSEVMDLVPSKIRPKLKIVSIEKGGKKLSDNEMVRLYNESLITMSLSNFDTFGLVPLESMACGTPVVAFDVAGYRETIKNGETGYLVNFSSQDIADKIIRLLSNREMCIKMGEKGREWVVKNWTWDKQVRNLEKYLLKRVN